VDSASARVGRECDLSYEIRKRKFVAEHELALSAERARESAAKGAAIRVEDD
jgi:hypothetical protein